MGSLRVSSPKQKTAQICLVFNRSAEGRDRRGRGGMQSSDELAFITPQEKHPVDRGSLAREKAFAGTAGAKRCHHRRIQLSDRSEPSRFFPSRHRPADDFHIRSESVCFQGFERRLTAANCDTAFSLDRPLFAFSTYAPSQSHQSHPLSHPLLTDAIRVTSARCGKLGIICLSALGRYPL